NILHFYFSVHGHGQVVHRLAKASTLAPYFNKILAISPDAFTLAALNNGVHPFNESFLFISAPSSNIHCRTSALPPSTA
ncbi:hypothetical protein BpHYR1_034894, partial [Brachionus plicatilis]